MGAADCNPPRSKSLFSIALLAIFVFLAIIATELAVFFAFAWAELAVFFAFAWAELAVFLGLEFPLERSIAATFAFAHLGQQLVEFAFELIETSFEAWRNATHTAHARHTAESGAKSSAAAKTSAAATWTTGCTGKSTGAPCARTEATW